MVRSRRTALRLSLAAAVVPTVLLLGVPPASAAVTTVNGSAEGYSLKVSLFAGPVNTRGVGQVACTGVNTPPGCAPTPAASSSPAVYLPSTGGSLTQVDADGTSGIVGPAEFFSSGKLTTTSSGTTGPTGSVSSTTTIVDVGIGGSENFSASKAIGECSADKGSGARGSATITGGVLFTESGDDQNGDGDFTDPGEHAPVTVPVPASPAPNTSFTGHLHVNDVVETFQYVFNEQVMNPDGSITVYAGHEYLFGPTAVGDMYFGKVTCGVGLGPSDCRTGSPTVVGTPGDDLLVGTSGRDVILGLEGNDRILGLEGNDLICGGPGDDRLVGGSGDDDVRGGGGNDTMAGDDGDDYLAGGDGDDLIRGGAGDDRLDGRDGFDTCRPGSAAGDDKVFNCEADGS